MLEIFNLLSANAHNLVESKILNFSTLKALADKNLNVPETVEFDLTHYQMTNFRLFQTESLQTTISNLTKMAESYPNR